MCITSLAPVAPLLAPFTTLYYLIFIPMLRWLNIFVYRPKVRCNRAYVLLVSRTTPDTPGPCCSQYDAGGIRFPIYHDIVISSLILGQLLIAASIFLKQAVFAGAIVGALIVPTYLFSVWTKQNFYRAYMDAGLLQTSQLDGWGVGHTLDARERYRRWLVDTHKASYVPLCLSGGEDFLTSQPAVTVPTLRETAAEEEKQALLNVESGGDSPSSVPSRPGLQRWKGQSSRYLANTSQKGAVFRRFMDA